MHKPLLFRTFSFLNLALALLLSCATVWAQDGDSAMLSGTISEAGSGAFLEGVTVVVSDLEDAWMVADAVTASDGSYTVEVPMDAGQSRQLIVEAAGPAHAPARYNGESDTGCFFNCGGDSGAMTVSENDQISNLDIALDPGGAVSGTITSANDDAVLEAAYVELRRTGDGWGYSVHFQAASDDTGTYQTPLAVEPGDYHLLAGPGATDNYVVQAWQDYPCQHSTCPILDTDTVALTAGSVTSDIDFSLQPGATIAGSLQPEDIQRIIRLYDGAGLTLDQMGFFSFELPAADWSFDGLAGGSYYIELGPFTGQDPYVRILHNGLLCPFSGCNRASGEPITIPPGSSLTLAEITLPEGGQIAGNILDKATGLTPAVDGEGRIGTYDIIDAGGKVVGGGNIVQDEGDILLSPSAAVPPGDYFVRTYNHWLGAGIGYAQPRGVGQATITGYSDAVFPDVACAGIDCDLTAATAVTVTQGNTTNITIEVTTGSNITGSVVDDTTSEGIQVTIVKLVDAGHELLATTSTDEDGNFYFGAFPAGTYYLRTAMSSQYGPGHFGFQNPYFDRVYGAPGLCSEQLCDPLSGTAITLDGSSDPGPFELRVEPGPVVSGRIIYALTGLLINNGYVEVFDDNETFVGRYRINPNSGRYQTTALPPGDYTLVPVVSPAFSDVSTSGGNSIQSATSSREQSSGKLVVTVGSDDVEADLRVIDDGLDLIFDDRFSEE